MRTCYLRGRGICYVTVSGPAYFVVVQILHFFAAKLQATHFHFILSLSSRLHCEDLPLWIPASEEFVLVLVNLQVGDLQRIRIEDAS